MADSLNYFSDNEESEWLANIDISLLGKSNEEKQLDNSEIPRTNSVPLHSLFGMLTRPTGSSKYGTTRKNTQRYYTTKRLITYILSWIFF